MFFLFLAVVAFSCSKEPLKVDNGSIVVLELQDPQGNDESEIGGTYGPGRHYVIPPGKKAVSHTLSTKPVEYSKVVTVTDKNNLRCSFTGLMNYTQNPDFADNLLFKNTSANKKLGNIVESVEADICRSMLWGEDPSEYLSNDSLLEKAGITLDEFISWSDYSYDRYKLSLLIESEAMERFKAEYPDMNGSIHLNYFLIIDHKIPGIINERRLKETKETLQDVVVPLEVQYEQVQIMVAKRRANMSTEIDKYIERAKKQALNNINSVDEEYVAKLESISAMLRKGTTMHITMSEFVNFYGESIKK